MCGWVCGWVRYGYVDGYRYIYVYVCVCVYVCPHCVLTVCVCVCALTVCVCVCPHCVCVCVCRDVSNSAMQENRLQGLWNLTILTSLVNVLPLLLLRLLPNSAEEQEALSKNKEQSRLGGTVFLCILFGSILWSFGTAGVQLWYA
jgi:hypothetical protein